MLNFLSIYEELQEKLDTINPSEIKQIRKSYNMSQSEFARVLRISVRTLQNNEQGHRKPTGSGVALYNLAKEHPKIFKGRYTKKQLSLGL